MKPKAPAQFSTVESSAASPEAIFRDVVRYDTYFTPFVDDFAQFAVSFPSGWPMGPGTIYPRCHQLTTQPLERALCLMLRGEDGEELVAVHRQETECLPWVMVERTTLSSVVGGILKVEARHCFAGRRSLLSRFTFSNDGARPLEVRPVWTGWFATDEYMGRMDVGGYETLSRERRATFSRRRPSGVVGGLKCVAPKHELPGVAVAIDCRSHSDLGTWIGTDPYWAGMGGDQAESGRHFALGTDLTLALGPGERVEVLFEMRFASAWHARPKFAWPEHTDMLDGFDGIEAACRRRFLNSVGWEKPVASTNAALSSKAWRARFGLLRCGLEGDDGEFRGEIASLCTADGGGFSTSFFWDTLFSSVAIVDWNRRYAQGAITTAFVRQLPRDGSTPENKFNYTLPYRHTRQYPQAPVATWALLEYFKATGDLAFVRERFFNCLENHRYWEDFGDRDRDGLAEWLWGGQTADNSPLWDVVNPEGKMAWLPPVASVALNSFLYWDADSIRAVARLLGESSVERKFQQRMESLWSAFEAVCYSPSEGRYWDFNHATGEHRRLKSFYMFWPLVAGMPVPQSVAADLIDNVLLDPNQFFGVVPFPSVAYDEPSYEPTGYWRGKAWPHISYWLLQMLCRYGYQETADKAADRILSWYSLHGGLRENMATDPHLSEPKGQLDYNWGCAAFYLIANRTYRQSGHGENRSI